MEGAKEKIEWWKSSEEHLIRRTKELDAQAEKLGMTEKGFRWVGEKYNKLGWKSKLAVGAGLGLGAVVTAGSLAMVFPLLGIAAQRAAGLSTMYLKFERTSHDQKWGKEKAMLKAGIYTALMGLAIKEAIEYANETELAHAAQAKVENWLGSMLGHEQMQAQAPMSETPPGANVSPDSAAGKIIEEVTRRNAEAAQAAAVPIAGEVPTSVPTETPIAAEAAAPASEAAPAGAGELVSPPPGAPLEISVEATPGKGYEYMMKRLWEGLQEKGLDASQYAEGSDMHKLLTATPENIDTVVHQIAADPAHGFFNADNTSVRIDLGSQMTFGADGNILLNEAVQAPAGAPVTPAYQPEVSAAQETAPLQDAAEAPVQSAAATEGTSAAETSEAAESLSRSLSSEAAAPAEASLASETVATPEPVQTVDLTQEQDLANQQAAETAARATAEQAPVVINQFGLSVPTGEAHIYTDPSDAHTLVYGGTAAEQAKAIQQHLLSNPDGVVYGTDDTGTYLIPFHLLEGKVAVGPPMRTSGIFGFFSTWMKAPEPDDLAKFIK